MATCECGQPGRECQCFGDANDNLLALDTHLSPKQERRIRAIVREEIAAYFASVSKSEAGAPHITVNVTEKVDPARIIRTVERAVAESARRGGPLRIYRDRDEPPAVPPIRVVNTTEPL